MTIATDDPDVRLLASISASIRNDYARAEGHVTGPHRTGEGPVFRPRRGRRGQETARRPRLADRATRGGTRAGAARLLARSAVAAAGLWLVLAGAAAAHSWPETTAPADGDVVAETPAVIAISFDDPMRVTWIELTGAGGEPFALERTDGMAPVTRFEAAPPPLPAGRYTVKWRGLSADGHPMSGRFSFDVVRP